MAPFLCVQVCSILPDFTRFFSIYISHKNGANNSFGKTHNPPVAITIFASKLFSFCEIWKSGDGRTDRQTRAKIVITGRDCGSASWIKIRSALIHVLKIFAHKFIFDPLGRPTVTAGSDHCFRTCCPSVRPYIHTYFSTLEKQNNRKQCSLLA